MQSPSLKNPLKLNLKALYVPTFTPPVPAAAPPAPVAAPPAPVSAPPAPVAPPPVAAFAPDKYLSIDLQQELVQALSKSGLRIWRAAVALGCTCHTFKNIVAASECCCSIGEPVDDYRRELMLGSSALMGNAMNMSNFDRAEGWFWINRADAALSPTMGAAFTFARSVEGSGVHQLEYTVDIDLRSFVKEATIPAGWRKAQQLHEHRVKLKDASAEPPRKMSLTKQKYEATLDTDPRKLSLIRVKCGYRHFHGDPTEAAAQSITAPAGFGLTLKCPLEISRRSGRYYFNPSGLDVALTGAFPLSDPGIANYMDRAGLHEPMQEGLGVKFRFAPPKRGLGLRELAGFDPNDRSLIYSLRNPAKKEADKRRKIGFCFDETTGDFTRVCCTPWTEPSPPSPEARLAQKRKTREGMNASLEADEAASDVDFDPMRDLIPPFRVPPGSDESDESDDKMGLDEMSDGDAEVAALLPQQPAPPPSFSRDESTISPSLLACIASPAPAASPSLVPDNLRPLRLAQLSRLEDKSPISPSLLARIASPVAAPVAAPAGDSLGAWVIRLFDQYRESRIPAEETRDGVRVVYRPNTTEVAAKHRKHGDVLVYVPGETCIRNSRSKVLARFEGR